MWLAWKMIWQDSEGQREAFTVPYTAAPLGDQKEEEERAWTFIELGYVIKDEWQTEAKRLVFEPPSTKPSPRKMARTGLAHDG